MRRTFLLLVAGVLAVSSVAPADTAAVTTERSGSAGWVRFGVVRYGFSFVEQRASGLDAGSTSIGVHNTPSGYASASLELCPDGIEAPCELGQTWSGPLGAAITNGASIDADPLLQRVTFRGWLRADETGPPCEFFVTWDAGATPPTPSADPPAFGFDRTAVATVDATCWQTQFGDPAFDQGTGALHGSLAAAAG